MLVKTDGGSFQRDIHSGAIINTNDDEYLRFMGERARAKETARLKNEVTVLSQEVQQIKQMLQKVLASEHVETNS